MSVNLDVRYLPPSTTCLFEAVRYWYVSVFDISLDKSGLEHFRISQEENF
jgi:hypothetical protein